LNKFRLFRRDGIELMCHRTLDHRLYIGVQTFCTSAGISNKRWLNAKSLLHDDEIRVIEYKNIPTTFISIEGLCRLISISTIPDMQLARDWVSNNYGDAHLFGYPEWDVEVIARSLWELLYDMRNHARNTDNKD